MPPLPSPQASPVEQPEHPLAVRVPFAPRRSGVYLFKDRAGQVIYVGKAAVLRSRLASYFGHQGGLGPRQRQLVARTTDFELVVTASEKEALLLEASLIKEHRPALQHRAARRQELPVPQDHAR